MSRFGPVPEVPGTPGATVRVWVCTGAYDTHTDAVLDEEGRHPIALRFAGRDYAQADDAEQYPGVRRYVPAAVVGGLW